MGNLLLCWATVILWVRVALNGEWQFAEEEVWCDVVCMDIFWKDSEALASFCTAGWWISILKEGFAKPGFTRTPLDERTGLKLKHLQSK